MSEHRNIRKLKTRYTIMFLRFNRLFFKSQLLGKVSLEWRKNMEFTGICYITREYTVQRKGTPKKCVICVNEAMLEQRSFKETIEVLLHEMIHAYFHCLGIREANGGHGKNFKQIMNWLNALTGVNISPYHTFPHQQAPQTLDKTIDLNNSSVVLYDDINAVDIIDLEKREDLINCLFDGEPWKDDVVLLDFECDAKIFASNHVFDAKPHYFDKSLIDVNAIDDMFNKDTLQRTLERNSKIFKSNYADAVLCPVCLIRLERSDIESHLKYKVHYSDMEILG